MNVVPDDDESVVAAFKVRWWRDKYFTGERAHFWPEELEQCPVWPENPAYQAVTREHVFRIAGTDGPHRNVRTAVAAYVWGVGKSVYQIGWLVRAFMGDTADTETRLNRAADLLSKVGPAAAYESMLLPGAANNIKFMGPAFFTKFFFFTGYRRSTQGSVAPLILDKRVATGLRAWCIRPCWPDGGWPPWSDGGWSSSQYASYLNYSARQPPDSPETVEQRLFRAGRRNGAAGSRPDHWTAT